MKPQPFVLKPEDYDPALNVIGTKVTVLASNAATQAYEITLQKGDEGMGPPPHSHNWDESFYVISFYRLFYELCDDVFFLKGMK